MMTYVHHARKRSHSLKVQRSQTAEKCCQPTRHVDGNFKKRLQKVGRKYWSSCHQIFHDWDKYFKKGRSKEARTTSTTQLKLNIE